MRRLGALVMLGSMLILNAYAESGTVFQKGTASWYGNPYHGRKAADGSRYNMYQMTAAHPSLPFGTKIKVENQKTGESVVLKVTDRGPFAKGRVLDVSKVAAVKLGMIKSGTAPVLITVLGKKETKEDLGTAQALPPVVEPAVDLIPTKQETVQEESKITPEQERAELLAQLSKITARLKELEGQ